MVVLPQRWRLMAATKVTAEGGNCRPDVNSKRRRALCILGCTALEFADAVDKIELLAVGSVWLLSVLLLPLPPS